MAKIPQKALRDLPLPAKTIIWTTRLDADGLYDKDPVDLTFFNEEEVCGWRSYNGDFRIEFRLDQDGKLKGAYSFVLNDLGNRKMPIAISFGPTPFALSKDLIQAWIKGAQAAFELIVKLAQSSGKEVVAKRKIYGQQTSTAS